MAITLLDVWTPRNEDYLDKVLREANGFPPTPTDVHQAMGRTVIDPTQEFTELLVGDLCIRYVDVFDTGEFEFELEWL